MGREAGAVHRPWLFTDRGCAVLLWHWMTWSGHLLDPTQQHGGDSRETPGRAGVNTLPLLPEQHFQARIPHPNLCCRWLHPLCHLAKASRRSRVQQGTARALAKFGEGPRTFWRAAGPWKSRAKASVKPDGSRVQALPPHCQGLAVSYRIPEASLDFQKDS